jgi:hypothetical protein
MGVKMKRIDVVSVDQYDADFPASNLVKTIAWLSAKLAEIPEEHRENATCEIGSVSSWEDRHYACIEIAYSRPATKEEAESAARELHAAKMAHEAEERLQFERLKAKFG